MKAKIQPKKLEVAVMAIAVLITPLVCSTVLGSPGDQSVTEKPSEKNAKKSARKKPGYHTGGFRIRPSVSITQRYDDNVFSAATNEVSDWLTEITPKLKIDSTWDQHSIRLDTGAHIGRHWNYESENYKDFWVKGDARYELSSNTNVFGGITISRKHEGRDAEDAVLGGSEPTVYHALGGHAGIKTKVGNTTYQFGSTFESLDYRNVDAGTTLLFNDDRDRDLHSHGFRATHKLDDQHAVFAQGLYATRDYDRLLDSDGYHRDSNGHRLAIGAKRNSPDGTRLEGYVGILAQNYDDARFHDVEKFDFGGKLTVSPAKSTKVTAKLEHALNETTEPASPGYLVTSLSGKLEHKISPRLIPYISGSHVQSDYLQSARQDKTYSGELGIKYFFTPNAYVATGIRHSQRDSNDAGLTSGSYDYEKNAIFISFTLLGYPLTH